MEDRLPKEPTEEHSEDEVPEALPAPPPAEADVPSDKQVEDPPRDGRPTAEAEDGELAGGRAAEVPALPSIELPVSETLPEADRPCSPDIASDPGAPDILDVEAPEARPADAVDDIEATSVDHANAAQVEPLADSVAIDAVPPPLAAEPQARITGNHFAELDGHNSSEGAGWEFWNAHADRFGDPAAGPWARAEICGACIRGPAGQAVMAVETQRILIALGARSGAVPLARRTDVSVSVGFVPEPPAFLFSATGQRRSQGKIVWLGLAPPALSAKRPDPDWAATVRAASSRRLPLEGADSLGEDVWRKAKERARRLRRPRR